MDRGGSAKRLWVVVASLLIVAPDFVASAPRYGDALPDTVLARVGSERVISVADFRRAWNKVDPADRPDSLAGTGARTFLDLLIGKEALALEALRSRWEWTADESARYEGMRDQLVMHVVLDSALESTRRARAAVGQPPMDAQGLGIVARDSTVARLALRIDAGLCDRLARAFAALPRPSPDSSLFAQLWKLSALPHVDEADLNRPIATCSDGPFTVGDLMASWKRISPVARPRIESSAEVADLVRNAVFERLLRSDAERRGVEHWPEVSSALAREREYFAVEHLVEREVYQRISTDSLTLRRFFEGRSHDWDLPLRTRVMRLVVSDRGEAAGLARRLQIPEQAESLLADARRRGVNYEGEYSSDSDSALFVRAMRAGPGAVLGPDSTRGGWAVARVEAVLPRRSRAFKEVQLLVAQRYSLLEAERLMRALLDRLRERVPVEVNERALAALAAL
jgi:hypothetical protein